MNRLLTVGVLLLSLLGAQSYGLNGQQAHLQAPVSGGYYQAREAFVIVLPEDMQEGLLRGLALEVDQIDVSAMMVKETGRLVYQPVTRLAPGKHEIRLLHYGTDGSVNELGYWEVEVRQSARFRDARVQGEFNLGFTHRVAASDDFTSLQSRDTFMHSNGQVATFVETTHWRTEGNMSLFYAEDPAMSLTGRTADIPGFFLNTTSGNFSVNVGDHAVASADLVNDGFQRRGLSSAVNLPAMHSAITVFSTSASQRVGIEGGLGIGEDENRMNGARWQYQPLQSANAHIVLSSSFLSGKVSETDFATIDNDPYNNVVNEGEAWNIALDSQFFQRQLRLRFENANSRYDFDGVDVGFEALEDEAWSALILFDPAPTQSEKPLDWLVGVEAQETGAYYKSLGNRQLPADKAFQRAFLNGSRDKWNWNVSYAEENNNLEDNTDYALTNTRQWVLGGAYQEYASPPAGSFFAWLGQPAFTWYATAVEVEDEYTPAGYLVNDLSTRSASANAIFSHQTWNWSVAYNHDSLEDHSGWQPQTRTRAFGVNTSMQLGKRYYLALGWQLQQTDYVAENVDTHRQLYSLEARAEFIPDRLSANISVGINQNNAVDDPYYALRDKSTYSSGSLVWRAKKPTRDQVGLDLSLSLMRNDFSDFINTANNMDGYQVFLKINTILPLNLPEMQ